MRASDERPGAGFRHALLFALREPLVHFLAAGLALFALYGLLHPEQFAADTSRRIELSAADVQRIELAFAAQWQRRPTQEELRSLLAEEVRSEILAREAIALGLDKGDVIVKRRLAQKMAFLSDDLSNLREPGAEELRAWFDTSKSRFEQPARITFRHVFFSTDRRGADAEAAARKALSAVSGRSGSAPRGDPFMFHDRYTDRTETQLAQELGSGFARAVFSLPTGSWSGPVESGLGWHLVRTEEIRAAAVPSYDQVATEVREQWMSEQREKAKRARFESMLARYEVVLPGPK